MIKEEQQKYIQLLLAGDTEGARKLATYKRTLIDVWSSDGGYFKLLPHYLMMKLIQGDKSYWKDSVKMAIQLAYEQDFKTVNGNSRENGMSILHAYILGCNLNGGKRNPEKIIEDLREIYKIGWRPHKITEETVKHAQKQSGWSQTSMNELGFAFMSNMNNKVLEALIKVFPVNEPCTASGMTMMQYSAKELMSDMMIKVASLGGDFKKRGEVGLYIPSGKDILKSDDAWFDRIRVVRTTDTNLLKIMDKKIWESKIYALETRLNMEQGIYVERQKKVEKEKLQKEKQEAYQTSKTEKENKVVDQASPDFGSGIQSQEPPPRKAFKRRILNHD